MLDLARSSWIGVFAVLSLFQNGIIGNYTHVMGLLDGMLLVSTF